MTTGAEAINNDDKVLNKFLQHKEPAIAAFARWPSRLWWPKMIKMIDGPIVTLRGKVYQANTPYQLEHPRAPFGNQPVPAAKGCGKSFSNEIRQERDTWRRRERHTRRRGRRRPRRTQRSRAREKRKRGRRLGTPPPSRLAHPPHPHHLLQACRRCRVARRRGSPRPSRGRGYGPGRPAMAPTSRPSTESATSKPKRGAGWTASASLLVANFNVPATKLQSYEANYEANYSFIETLA